MVARHVTLHPVHDGGQDLVGLVFQTPIILERKKWVSIVTLEERNPTQIEKGEVCGTLFPYSSMNERKWRILAEHEYDNLL